jgi:Domain of unknown function (DUF4112)
MEAMARSYHEPGQHLLDFIIFGVARSGTGALARALNLHPHVYCARERFHFRDNHGLISFPDSFVNATGIEFVRHKAKVSRVKAELAQKAEILHVGNKLPRYYFALDRLNREVPKLKNILIYRSPRGFIPSWNRRELAKRQWPPGQIGLFGLLELFVCIDNCLRQTKDILVFPYESGLKRSIQPIVETIEFLGANTELYDRHTFERRQLMRTWQASSHLQLANHEVEILDTLRVCELDELMDQGSGMTIAQLATPLKEYMSSIADLLPHAFDRAFRACTDYAVQHFGERYFERYRHELSGFLKLMERSTTIAGFRRLSLHRRLASRSRAGLLASLPVHIFGRGMSRQQRLNKVRWIASTMDDQFTVPGMRIRFGWDSIIGLLPVVGDVVTSVASVAIINHAWRLGVPSSMLRRMIGNVSLDLAFGCIPILGDAFDLIWKANRRNAELIEAFITPQRPY